jgi:hypothetical protein
MKVTWTKRPDRTEVPTVGTVACDEVLWRSEGKRPYVSVFIAAGDFDVYPVEFLSQQDVARLRCLARALNVAADRLAQEIADESQSAPSESCGPAGLPVDGDEETGG